MMSLSEQTGASYLPERQVERDRMVEEQIMARGINNETVIAAMRLVPRHRFVQVEDLSDAYGDYPLVIGYGQTISQPYMAAYMTAVLQLEPRYKVLEVGTGSGYQTAILAKMVSKVFTIEIVRPLAQRAKQILCDLGCDNVRFRVGDGYNGWPEEGPFDAIILSAAPNHIPQPLIEQLATGGRLVLPIGEHSQNLVLIQCTPDKPVHTQLLPVSFVPMTGQAQER